MTLHKEIDVICVFNRGKRPVPRKFKITYNNGDVQTVTVDQVNRIEQETPLGLHTIVYSCTSEVNGVLVDYIIRYYVKEMRWELYRTAV